MPGERSTNDSSAPMLTRKKKVGMINAGAIASGSRSRLRTERRATVAMSVMIPTGRTMPPPATEGAAL